MLYVTQKTYINGFEADSALLLPACKWQYITITLCTKVEYVFWLTPYGLPFPALLYSTLLICAKPHSLLVQPRGILVVRNKADSSFCHISLQASPFIFIHPGTIHLPTLSLHGARHSSLSCYPTISDSPFPLSSFDPCKGRINRSRPGMCVTFASVRRITLPAFLPSFLHSVHVIHI